MPKVEPHNFLNGRRTNFTTNYTTYLLLIIHKIISIHVTVIKLNSLLCMHVYLLFDLFWVHHKLVHFLSLLGSEASLNHLFVCFLHKIQQAGKECDLVYTVHCINDQTVQFILLSHNLCYMSRWLILYYACMCVYLLFVLFWVHHKLVHFLLLFGSEASLYHLFVCFLDKI